MTSAAAAINVDDNVVVPSNGDSAAVSFLPAPLLTMAASLSPSEPSHVVRSASGDSTTRRAAVAALSSNDTQRPTEEEEEDRELFIVSYRIFIMLNRYSVEEFIIGEG